MLQGTSTVPVPSRGTASTNATKNPHRRLLGIANIKRATVTIAKDATAEQAIAAAKADEKVKEILEGKAIIKEIYVPGKIINIVAK